MSIDEIIRAWKADEDDQVTHAFANPIGEELSDQEMQMMASRCNIPSITFICPACGGGPSCTGTTGGF